MRRPAVLPLVLLLGATGCRASALESAPAAETRTSRPVVLVGGDAVARGGVGKDLVDALSLQGRAVVHEGSGFATGVRVARSVVDDVPEGDLAAVVVQSGELDIGQPAGVTELAVLHMVDRLRAQVPLTTSLTIIGPIPEEVTPAALEVRDEVARAAKAKRVHFVDPIALRLDRSMPDLGRWLALEVRPFVPTD